MMSSENWVTESRRSTHFLKIFLSFHHCSTAFQNNEFPDLLKQVSLEKMLEFSQLIHTGLHQRVSDSIINVLFLK